MASPKNILENLPLKKREMLCRLFETEEYAVLKEAIQLLRENAGVWALDAMNFEEVKHLQGQAHGLKMLHQNIKLLHDKQQKELDAKAKPEPKP